MEPETVRVILADDNQAIRKRIKKILDRVNNIEVIGEAENGVEALRLTQELRPDMLLLDVEMPLLDGIEVTRQLSKQHNKVPILVLSAYNNRDYIREMLANGVSGYLVKEEAPDRIIEAILGIAQGETGWVSPSVKAKLLK